MTKKKQPKKTARELAREARLAKIQAKVARNAASTLSCDPRYRSMVQAYWKPLGVVGRTAPGFVGDLTLLAIINDYREERGALPLRAGMSAPVSLRPGVAGGFLVGELDIVEERERDAAFAAKHADTALAVGRSYHEHVHSLYSSKFGDVLLGRGGQETVDRDRYSKGYHSSFGPARNLNGGARVVGHGKDARIVLENSRGTEKARLPIPPRDADLMSWIQDQV